MAKQDDQIADEPTVTDEDKAKLDAIGGAEDEVENPQGKDESPKDTKDKKKEAKPPEAAVVTEEEEPETPESETDAEVTFTKKFPNLKGENLEEYVPSLETAYD